MASETGVMVVGVGWGEEGIGKMLFAERGKVKDIQQSHIVRSAGKTS